MLSSACQSAVPLSLSRLALRASLPDKHRLPTLTTHRIICQMSSGNQLWLLTKLSVKWTQAISYGYSPHLCQLHSGNQLRLLTEFLPDALWQSATATHWLPARCTLAISYSYSPDSCQMHSGNQLRLLIGFLPKTTQATDSGYSPNHLSDAR